MGIKWKLIIFLIVCIFLFPQKVKADYNFKENNLFSCESVIK